MNKTKPANRVSTMVFLILSLAFTLPTILTTTIKAAPSTFNVNISEFSFNPRNTTIVKGDTIVWANNDQVIHTLWFTKIVDQSTYLLSPPILPGQMWSHTFNETVELQYYSFKYLWITGFVTVNPVTHDIAITSVTPSQTQATIGETIFIDVTVNNEGNVPETFNVTAYYDDTTIEAQTNITLDAGMSTTLTFTWDTAGIDPGSYTVKAQASAVPGEINTADNSFIDGQVTLSTHDIAITQVTRTPTSVKVGEAVYINVTVESQGSATETFDVTAYYNTSSIETKTGITLDAGESVTLEFSWNTTGVSEGTYTISAEASQVLGETETANNRFTDGTVTILPIEEAPPFPIEYIIAMVIVIALIVGGLLYYFMKRRRSSET
jgi:plastocyanin